MTLQEAVTDLHRVAVVEELTQSPQRLQGLAIYCIQELNRRGVDWTWGCVSLANADVERLARLVPVGTLVLIED